MGLDNGIILKTKTPIDLDTIPAYVNVEDMSMYYKDENVYAYECCYWRNCWTTRNEIINTCPNARDCEEGESELNKKDVQIVQDILVNYLKNPESWDEGRSIWDFDEMAGVLSQQVINLGWLLQYMSDKANQHWIVEFYDSY